MQALTDAFKIEVRYSAGRTSPRAGARGALYRHRDADDTCNFLEIPNLLGPLFLAGMQVVLSGIFTSMVLLNRGEGQE